MFTFLEALMPAYDYDKIHATPSTLKEWTCDGGPRAKVAAFVDDAAAPVQPGTVRALLHDGGVRTCVSLHVAEGVC